MKRRKLGGRKSRKMFSRSADRIQSINLRGSPMRGGIRL